MEKYVIGHNFEVPKKYKDCEIFNFGGYQGIISETDGVLVQGIKLINLFKEPISVCGIIPLDSEMTEKLTEFPFEPEKHKLMYQVSYGDYAWYFVDKVIAYGFMDFIVRVKELALYNKI